MMSKKVPERRDLDVQQSYDLNGKSYTVPSEKLLNEASAVINMDNSKESLRES